MSARRLNLPYLSGRGFTLVEAVVVIAIAGIIAAMLAVFIRAPVEAYIDTTRRARLTELADTALRRMARDLQAALPNSVRITAVGGSTYLEFIPVVGGARYRQYPTAGSAGDVLDFATTDSAADLLGPVPVYGAGLGAVVFNLGPGSGADAYAGNNRAAVTSANAVDGLFSNDAAPHTLTFAAVQFPLASPGARVHLVNTPVTYECVPNAANPALGVLRRHVGYGFFVAQPTPPAAASSLLAAQVAECNLTYDPDVTRMRTGLVTLWLRLEESGESIRLVHQMHVENAP
ncbi:MAG: type II secretion system protein [Betaproteobacteria bacterium HGW-Betaproteobacteria-12]|nr:MAG: type II secretion system protein [Betaproteobacteria bacterium HGW-Betaproteobacteria-12]